MSSLVVFVAGAVVFALTVYGAVMSMGLMLHRSFRDQNHRYGAPVVADPADRVSPVGADGLR
jgi:hypothetical protein